MKLPQHYLPKRYHFPRHFLSFSATENSSAKPHKAPNLGCWWFRNPAFTSWGWWFIHVDPFSGFHKFHTSLVVVWDFFRTITWYHDGNFQTVLIHATRFFFISWPSSQAAESIKILTWTKRTGFKNWSAQSTYRQLLFSIWPRLGKWMEDPLPPFNLGSQCLTTFRTWWSCFPSLEGNCSQQGWHLFSESHLVSISGFNLHIPNHIPANLQTWKNTTSWFFMTKKEISCLYDLHICQPCHKSSSKVSQVTVHSV